MRRGSRAYGHSKNALVLASVLSIVAPSGAVMADDAGMRAFFRDQSGAGGSVAQPVYAPAPQFSDTRPLIVRPHRRTAARKPTVKVAVAGLTGPVSIYDDTTLRPGDAVMTSKGLRVFMGGHSAPYTDTDFVALKEADGLPRQVEKALVMIDQAPHG